MSFKKGHRKVGGRQRGTPNKTSVVLKDTILEVVERLGGAQGLYEWVKGDPENERAFWVSIAPKLLPMEFASSKDSLLQGTVTVVWQPPVANYRELDEQPNRQPKRASGVESALAPTHEINGDEATASVAHRYSWAA
jgi:hypothetical protein